MADLEAESLRTPAWADREDHRQWLRAEGRRLLRHYARARAPDGFATLGNDGQLVDDTPQSIITARNVHCYSLAAIMGVPGATPLAVHGITALLDGPLRDQTSRGWFEDASGASRKMAYLHAFIALAGASATMAEMVRGEELMRAAMDVIDQHFWIEDEQVMQPSFAADWSDPEAYRGANGNMHTTEACLAVSDATGDRRWLDRALALARRFGHDIP
ncbi:MAG: AGE family epimerase/isomerase, partial [Henriciella sp.]|uniref:AGE family epimerase/isomerase n=1 Tax=Henriciella sp. TaxID=1968823 RepID=UPI003C724DC7